MCSAIVAPATAATTAAVAATTATAAAVAAAATSTTAATTTATLGLRPGLIDGEGVTLDLATVQGRNCRLHS